jgi:hypothetical protein
MRFCVRLAVRFARSLATARSASIVFVAAAFLLAIFVTLQSLALSGRQMVERDLGRFGAFVGYGAIVALPGDDRVTPDLLSAARGAGATDAMVFLSATNVQLVAAGPGGGPREIGLQEAAWASRPFPERYRLLSGRWPQRPLEVVVTEPGDVAVARGGELTALGGRTRFHVVGTADDRYARTSALLAGPGTWAQLPHDLATRFPVLRAQPVLFWSGNAEARVVAAFAAVAAARDGTEATDEAVAASLVVRGQLAATRGQSWIERTPAAYTIPSLLLPFAVVWLAFGLNSRRFNRSLRVLESLGVRRSTAAASLSLATAAWCVIAAVLGAVAGFIVGLGAGYLIANLRDLPAGPVSGITDPVLRLLVGVAAGAACAGILLFAGAREAPTPRASTTRPAARGRGRSARHLLAVATWCAAAIVAADLESAAETSILAGVMTVAVLLLVPEFVEVVLRLLPEGRATTRLSRRQLAGDRQRAIAAVAVLAVAVGGSLGYLTLLTTVVRTLETKEYPPVLSGQVMVADRSSIVFPPPVDVVEAVEASGLIRGKPRVELHYVHELDGAGNPTRNVTLEGTMERVLAIDTVGDVERLLTHPLTSREGEVLRRGGILVWADTPARRVARQGSAPLAITGTRVEPPVSLPATTVGSANAGWRVGTSGVLLTSTARRLDLPLSRGATLYVGLSPAEARALQRAVARAGFDARTIEIYEGLPSVVPPAALLATAAGLAIIALLVTLVAAHGQARVLRGYLRRLISIGLPVSWARHVLLYQLVVVMGAATVLGAVIAIAPLVIAEMRIAALVLSIPWTQVLVLMVSVYVAACLAAIQSSRSLRARGDALEQ